MGSDNSPTTHYREMIADLRSKLTEAQAKVAKFNRLIKELEDLYGPVVVGAAMTASVSLDARPTVMISPVVSNVRMLSSIRQLTTNGWCAFELPRRKMGTA